MKKVIKQVTSEGIIQVTIADERWYIKTMPDGTQKYVPSVTWVSSHYPKGIAFFKWLADKGWDEAEMIKSAAGDKGSKIHLAVGMLLEGKEVFMESKVLNPSTGVEEDLTLEEYEAVMSFVAWHKEVKPVFIAKELVVFNDEYNYAGTIDYLCVIDQFLYLIDFKTGQAVYPSYEIQVSSYKQALYKPDPAGLTWLDIPGYTGVFRPDQVRLGILQLGYRRTKTRFKFTPVEDKFDLFLSVYQIWENETKGVEPFKRDYPVSLKLEVEGGSISDQKDQRDNVVDDQVGQRTGLKGGDIKDNAVHADNGDVRPVSQGQRRSAGPKGEGRKR